MERYTLLRHLADSWGLLSMVVFFGGITLWIFRPGARSVQSEAAMQIFRNDDHPKDDSDGR
ncbi:MAG: cbb3-type cytochrome c oxidase subunit 3 [Amaricoccus sp.]|uniref:cbb3-type cytochrome c oxidase subunit 3 n=1 Tax=Amaricoccus sp. TaxID=1872485 RepID=UPI0039E6CFCA